MFPLLLVACFPRLDPTEDATTPVDTGVEPLVETRCGDGEDDDGDRDVDCDDADCRDASVCDDTDPVEDEDCDNGRDDDDDGDTDCDDSDCARDAACEAPDECWDQDLDGELGFEITSGTATGDDGEGSCGGANTSESMVYWTAPSSDTFTFDTVGSSADTTVWVTSEDCDGDELACDDDTFGTNSQVSVTLTRGDSVVVGIEAAGAWVLSAWQGDCPAYSIGSEDAVVGTTTSDFPTYSTSVCGSATSAVTLRWVAPSAGLWTFSSLGSDFDTILVLWEDECDGSELDCNDDMMTGVLTSEVSVYLDAGEVVAIGLGGYDGEAGDYALAIAGG